MTVPKIETDRLILRPLRKTDFDDYYEYAQDPDVARNGMWTPYASKQKAQEDFDQLLNRYEDGLMWWALELKENHKMIGRCQLSRYDPEDRHAEISYAIHQDFWGKGYMTEAAQCIARYGFENLKLHRLSAIVFPDNIASNYILIRLGMILEGKLRQHRFIDGHFKDILLYGVLAEEWETKLS